MIFYNIYNCTVSRFSQILKDSRYVSRVPMPLFVCNYMKRKLIKQRNLDSNAEENDRIITNEFYKTSLYLRINVLRLLYKSLRLEINQANENLFKHNFHKEFALDDFGLIESRLEKMVNLYETLQSENENKREFDFDQYITKLEHILSKDLSGKFIYQLKSNEENAMQLINSKRDGTE